MSDTRSTTEPAGKVQAHARRGLRWPVRVAAIDPEIDPVSGLPCYTNFEERSGNVSEGGVFVAMDDTLTPGRRVLVEVDLPGGETVQAVGAVVWRRIPQPTRPTDRPAGVGIEFTGMARSSARALADALEPARPRRKRGATRPSPYRHP